MPECWLGSSRVDGLGLRGWCDASPVNDRIIIEFTGSELRVLHNVLLNAVEAADLDFHTLNGATVDEVEVLSARLRDADPTWGVTPPQT